MDCPSCGSEMEYVKREVTLGTSLNDAGDVSLDVELHREFDVYECECGYAERVEERGDEA